MPPTRSNTPANRSAAGNAARGPGFRAAFRSGVQKQPAAVLPIPGAAAKPPAPDPAPSPGRGRVSLPIDEESYLKLGKERPAAGESASPPATPDAGERPGGRGHPPTAANPRRYHTAPQAQPRNEQPARRNPSHRPRGRPAALPPRHPARPPRRTTARRSRGPQGEQAGRPAGHRPPGSGGWPPGCGPRSCGGEVCGGEINRDNHHQHTEGVTLQP